MSSLTEWSGDDAGDGGPISGIVVGEASEASRVLIVDGDDEAREIAARALREDGLVVYEASNGLDALKLFAEVQPQLTLLEVMTPFLDGYSTCRSIRELPRGKHVAIVMMTELDDIESLTFGYEAGATDFVTKPLNSVILRHRVRYMLRATDAMTNLQASQKKLAHLADHDVLTGLPNRRSLEQYMQRLTAQNRTLAGAVYLIDLDGFKRVNDTLGHAAGDELIRQMGERISAAFTPKASYAEDAPLSRILARIGGDEFVFVDPDVTTDAETREIADGLLRLAASGFDIQGHHVSVTASIGVTMVSVVGRSIDDLMRSADVAMYEAKSRDRNNACFHSEAISERTRIQRDIENALRSPALYDQLELFYQPQIDLETNAVVGAEALLRWRHPERGLISPADFIPVAEETGLIVGIGRWVIGEACRQLCKWQNTPALRPLRVAVNVSARQFRDPMFAHDINSIIRTSGVEPSGLEVEITEGTLMTDTKNARALLRELKSLGIHVALDDFGTGYSSLGYLRQFPFDTLKVDRSFVSDILEDRGCSAITGAIIAMAKRLHLHVVAEGVETREQVECLRELGCEQGQGYLFSRPIAAADFEAWMSGRVLPPLHRRTARPYDERRISAIPPMRRA